MNHRSVFKRYGFAWVTLALFAVSLGLHWFFGWLLTLMSSMI
jgi:hypothetical protein